MTEITTALGAAFEDVLQNLKEQMRVAALEGLELALKQQNNATLSDWIDDKETFRILRLGKTKMQEIRTKGEVVWSKTGNKILYSKKSILELINRNKRN